MYDRKMLGMIVAEFLGTAILAMAVMGAAGYFNFTAPWYVGVSAGVTLAALVGIIGKVSGAHVNPAITLGLWSVRKIQTSQALVYLVAQVLGGLMALYYFQYVTKTTLSAGGLSEFQLPVFVAEFVGTAVFGFGVAAVVMQKIEGMQAAFTIGASLMIGILIAAVAAPAFLNPAVAIANNSLDWTTALAPLLGSVFGMNIYSLFLASKASLKEKAKN